MDKICDGQGGGHTSRDSRNAPPAETFHSAEPYQNSALADVMAWNSIGHGLLTPPPAPPEPAPTPPPVTLAVPPALPPRLRPSTHIIREVAARHRLTEEQLRGPSRLREVVVARCEAMREISAERPLKSYPEIGRLFGGRGHTTVMHHLDKTGQGRNTCSCDKHRAQAEATVHQLHQGESIGPQVPV